LEKERLQFKVSLVLNNAPGLSQPISIEDENVQVVFLSPNMAYLLQPLDQGIISCVKALYTRQDFEVIRAAIGVHLKLQVKNCWKSFSIVYVKPFIKAAMDELNKKRSMHAGRMCGVKPLMILKYFQGATEM